MTGNDVCICRSFSEPCSEPWFKKSCSCWQKLCRTIVHVCLCVQILQPSVQWGSAVLLVVGKCYVGHYRSLHAESCSRCSSRTGPLLVTSSLLTGEDRSLQGTSLHRTYCLTYNLWYHKCPGLGDPTCPCIVMHKHQRHRRQVQNRHLSGTVESGFWSGNCV